MGYNTTVVIFNDALHEIANDPEFGRKLVDAILGSSGSPVVNACVRRENGLRSSTAAVVVEQHHADETALVAVGGNTGTVIHTQFGSYQGRERVDEMLKQALASKWRPKQ